MVETHYLRMVSEASVDRDVQLRSRTRKMAERLVFLLCPSTRLNKTTKRGVLKNAPVSISSV